ncbi:hypothetical protein NQ317_018974 [Molorchus minor]|uniref:Polyprotein n=1 Tax=Molorchus minor TaxID=1323400 RepID=A0ABQ9IXV5_9CUCU|nr:hypothetical protein NQ317_018974 [Molorchus minor]
MAKKYEKQIVLPRARVNEVLQEVHERVEVYSLKLATRIDAIHDKARKKLQFESNKLETRYDARSNNSGYQAGDEVWLSNPPRKKGRSSKLQKIWEGPYTVIKRINNLVYRIQRGTPSENKSCSSGPSSPL